MSKAGTDVIAVAFCVTICIHWLLQKWAVIREPFPMKNTAAKDETCKQKIQKENDWWNFFCINKVARLWNCSQLSLFIIIRSMNILMANLRSDFAALSSQIKFLSLEETCQKKFQNLVNSPFFFPILASFFRNPSFA